METSESTPIAAQTPSSKSASSKKSRKTRAKTIAKVQKAKKARKPKAVKAPKKGKGKTGKRYSDSEKKEILDFIASKKYGGITAAKKEYGVSYIAIKNWKKKAGIKKGKIGKPAVKGKPGRPKGRPVGSGRSKDDLLKLIEQYAQPAIDPKTKRKILENLKQLTKAIESL